MKGELGEAEEFLHQALRLSHRSDNRKAIVYTYSMVRGRRGRAPPSPSLRARSRPLGLQFPSWGVEPCAGLWGSNGKVEGQAAVLRLVAAALGSFSAVCLFQMANVAFMRGQLDNVSNSGFPPRPRSEV